MTFDELFAEHHLTPRERELLVHHLAAMRYRKLLELLLPRVGSITEIVGGLND
jgi:hypothetical protein